MGCLDPLVGIEEGSPGVIVVRVEDGFVAEIVVGIGVGIAGTLGSLAGWW